MKSVPPPVSRDHEGSKPASVVTVLGLHYVLISVSGVVIITLLAGFLLFNASSNATQSLILLGVTALLIIAAILIFGRRGCLYISHALVELSRVADRLSQGELNARAQLKGPREVRYLAETLNSMADRLQASLDSLHAFVANASHELRTPLTGIKLHVGALRGGAIEDPEVAERFLGQVDNEIDRLEALVNDLLDLSQIEGSGIASQPVNLFDLACEVQSFWEARSLHKGLELTLHSPKTLPSVLGDSFRLRRLLDNLLDNAIKNTPSGGKVTMTLSLVQPGSWLRLEIQDTGIGIPPEHQAHIFERFYRVDPDPASRAAANGQCPGSGLGLAIAQSIVQVHNGRIGVTSQPGQGSTFWVELPVQPVTSETLNHPGAPAE